MELTCQTPKKGDQTKEGRHVGLDFYDLLIEAILTPNFLWKCGESHKEQEK